MRRKKQKKTEDKVYEASELKDAIMLDEIRTFNDEELQKAMAIAAEQEGFGIALQANHATDSNIVTIGMRTAWHARIVREVLATQMAIRAQGTKGSPAPDKAPGQYL